MNVNELAKDDRERLGAWKSWIAYYLYLLKYHHYRDGIFLFDGFIADVARYAIDLGTNSTIMAEIQCAGDFLSAERVFWQLAEELFSTNGDWRPYKSFVPQQNDVEASATLRAWYIADKQKYLACRRFLYRFAFDETRRKVVSEIYKDVNSVNAVDAVPKISMSLVDKETEKIANAKNFEELEIALECVSGTIWDSIQKVWELSL